MLPRSSKGLSDVIALANEIAHEYEQEYVGTEHVLLAIHREGRGLGAQVLKKLGATGSKLRNAVDKLIQKQLEETWVFGRLPGTPHFKNVMAKAIEQCQQLGGHEVCSEHLLLALLQERGCVAYQALAALDIQYDAARQAVLELAGEGSQDEGS